MKIITICLFKTGKNSSTILLSYFSNIIAYNQFVALYLQMESWKQLAGLSLTYLLHWALCSKAKRFVSHSSHSLMLVELSFLSSGESTIEAASRLSPCIWNTWLPHVLAATKEAKRLAWVDFKARASHFHPALAGTQSHGPAKLQGRLGNGSSLWAQEEETEAWVGGNIVWTQKEAYYYNKL